MSSSARFVVFCVACSLLGLAGASCKAHAEDHAQTASATAPASASAASAAVGSAAPTAKPWFAGAFQGNYDAKVAPVEVKTGAVRDWAADDGKLSSGPGKLALEIDDDGLVDGSSEGALGASTASGKVEDDTLRVVLAPNDTSGLHGVLLATRDGDGFRGAIEASSSDSLRVRQAPIELKKQAN
jgi:hypothetical protein